MAEGQAQIQCPGGASSRWARWFIYASHDVFIKFLGAHYSPFQTLFFAVLFSFPMVTFVLMQDATMANLGRSIPGGC